MDSELLINEVTNRVMQRLKCSDDSLVIHNFTIEKLCGIFRNSSNNEIKSLQNTIFTGKKVIIPYEEIELYKYKNTAPKAFYAYFENLLNILIESGVVVQNTQSEITFTIDKNIITERDIIKAKSEVITVRDKAIITELAKEYIIENGIKIIRKKYPEVRQ